MPKTTSKYAEAGRLAHAIAELKARKAFFSLSTRSYNSQLKKLQESPYYEKVMDGYTDRYVETLSEQAMTFKTPPFIALEVEVPIGVVTGENKDDGSPAGGTSDCIQIGEGILWVTDYKNGSGNAVSAEDNPQMKLYGLGALSFYRPFYGDTIHTVRMAIVQPANGGVSTWEISREDLEAWGRNVAAPAAAKAWAGEGEQCSGEWCDSHFCPIKATCRVRVNNALSLEKFRLSLPATLSPSEIADVLTRSVSLVVWYNSLKDYALEELLSGRLIPGFKAVEGRGSREWDDLDKAYADLQARGIDEALLWERKPVTPPALEKSLGKKVFTEVAEGHVVKKPGKPTLAPESDPRAAFNPAAIAFGTCPEGAGAG